MDTYSLLLHLKKELKIIYFFKFICHRYLSYFLRIMYIHIQFRILSKNYYINIIKSSAMIRILFNAIFILFNISKMKRNKSFQRSKINNYRYKDFTYPHRIILYDSRYFIEPEDRRKLKRWRDRFFPFLFHGIFANVLLLTNTGDVSLEFPEGLIKRACCR